MVSETKRRETVQALYRVRAVEQPPDAEGVREVWHKAGSGCEVISVVNHEGHMVQQEFTLFLDVVLWSRRGGVRSGALNERHPDDPVVFDATVSLERVIRAHDALIAYAGTDPYLLHLRDLLQTSRDGGGFNEMRVVTGPSLKNSGEYLKPVQPARVKSVVIAAIAAFVIAAGAAWLVIARG